MNLEVRFQELPASVKGMLVRIHDERFIVIQKNLCVQWQQFICGHEIGHYLLHFNKRKSGVPFLFTDMAGSDLERVEEIEANIFSCQLMKYNFGEDIGESLLKQIGVKINYLHPEGGGNLAR